jgi:hypothetical protein
LGTGFLFGCSIGELTPFTALLYFPEITGYESHFCEGIWRVMKDILDWFSKINSRSLLMIFGALTLLSVFPDSSPLADPFSLAALVLPVAMGMSYLMVLSWIVFIGRLNLGLRDGDWANMGVLIGGSGLAYCLCILLWYVSKTPDPLDIKILDAADFVRFVTLYLLSVVTMRVPRYPAAARGHEID